MSLICMWTNGHFSHTLGISHRMEKMLPYHTKGRVNIFHFSLCCVCLPGSWNSSLISHWGATPSLALSLNDSDETDPSCLGLVWGLGSTPNQPEYDIPTVGGIASEWAHPCRTPVYISNSISKPIKNKWAHVRCSHYDGHLEWWIEKRYLYLCYYPISACEDSS